MKAEEVTRLETTVRAANPYPSVEAVASSEELVRMDALVRLGTSSGSVPSVDGRDIMQTQQRPPRETSRWTRSGWVAAGYAFAVVLVIGFGLALLRTPSGGATSSPSNEKAAYFHGVFATTATSSSPTSEDSFEL